MFKKLILTLVGIALLLGFQATTNSDFLCDKFSVVDAKHDGESLEDENAEFEDLKFFSENFAEFKLYKFALHLAAAKNDNDILKNFSPVPTSPPNA